MRSRAWLGAVALAVVLGAIALSGKHARDFLVHALALGFLAVALVFQRRVVRSSGAWLPLSAVVMNMAVLTLTMRFWDLMADIDVGGPKEAADTLVLGSKFGERLAFIGLAYFLLRAVRVLQDRLQAEVRGE